MPEAPGRGPGGPTVVPISGTAIRGGPPVAGIELSFHPETGRPSWANTGAAGRLTLSYSRDRDGAVLGRHRVTVRGRERARYDGIIARADTKLASFARSTGVPLVNVWYSSPVRGVPLVQVDHTRLSQLAADHLQARGFRRFAHVGYGRIRSSADAERSFREALGEPVSYDRFTTDLNFTHTPGNFARFERSLGIWLEGLRRPVGVVVADDALARHVINAAVVRGIDVPGELAVVGQFNDEPFCLLAEPTLTSIDYGFDRIGYRAARLLDDLMAGHPAPALPCLLPPRELIPRDSTDVFASDDELVARALRFISDNCHKPINVGDVVTKLKVCGRTLARRFQKARGCRPMDELLRMRITRAKRLLQEGDASIKQVAEPPGPRPRLSDPSCPQNITGCLGNLIDSRRRRHENPRVGPRSCGLQRSTSWRLGMFP